jgi:thiol peroxidase
MAVERTGVVTLGGQPRTLLGPEVRAGDRAPDFTLVDTDLKPWNFYSETAGRVRLLSVVPSLDTGVCDLQTRRFEQECKNLPEGVVVLTVSMDLPFAQKRWQKEAGAEHIKLLSDHMDGSFGLTYGTLIKEMRVEARSVFVVDRNARVTYVQYVPEVTQHPDYDRALAAVRAAVG